ncbi:MAG TPA: PfkB family carbohydrate kinase, partial [Spirochaetota bacterium]|nr:PfkB family carbohydrate kinase [Spirochaetota bacterium]
ADKTVRHIKAAARSVFDVSGAGDTVIAVFTAALGAGCTPYKAALLANYAASVVVGKFGTASVTKKELLAVVNS